MPYNSIEEHKKREKIKCLNAKIRKVLNEKRKQTFAHFFSLFFVVFLLIPIFYRHEQVLFNNISHRFSFSFCTFYLSSFYCQHTCTKSHGYSFVFCSSFYLFSYSLRNFLCFYAKILFLRVGENWNKPLIHFYFISFIAQYAFQFHDYICFVDFHKARERKITHWEQSGNILFCSSCPLRFVHFEKI